MTTDPPSWTSPSARLTLPQLPSSITAFIEVSLAPVSHGDRPGGQSRVDCARPSNYPPIDKALDSSHVPLCRSYCVSPGGLDDALTLVRANPGFCVFCLVLWTRGLEEDEELQSWSCSDRTGSRVDHVQIKQNMSWTRFKDSTEDTHKPVADEVFYPL
uniref:Uncharacterized protein n=1 Tax=Knipowitschia caucasica TaxID=637954 RepID=A0AAV2J8B6_KNICA